MRSFLLALILCFASANPVWSAPKTFQQLKVSTSQELWNVLTGRQMAASGIKEELQDFVDDSSQIYKALGSDATPLPCRTFLIETIRNKFQRQDSRAPWTTHKKDFLFALFQAFKSSTSAETRELAYITFAHDILPTLSEELRDAVRRSLLAHVRNPGTAVYSLPALILIDPQPEKVGERLLEYALQNPNLQTRRRAVDAVRALIWKSPGRLPQDLIQNPSVQLALIYFLRDPDSQGYIRELAYSCFSGPKESPLVPANFLVSESVAELLNILKHDEPRQHKVPDVRNREVSARALTIRILGLNDERLVFDSTPRPDKYLTRSEIALRLDFEKSFPIEERSAALEAFVRIKPEDEASQKALAASLFRWKASSDIAYVNAGLQALGSFDKHAGKRRFQSEEVKYTLAYEAYSVGMKPLHHGSVHVSPLQKQATEGALELLIRNNPQSLPTYLVLIAAYQLVQRYPEDTWLKAISEKIVTICSAKGKIPVEEASTLALFLKQSTLMDQILPRLEIQPHHLVELLHSTDSGVVAKAVDLVGTNLKVKDRRAWLQQPNLDAILAEAVRDAGVWKNVTKLFFSLELPIENFPQTLTAILKCRNDHLGELDSLVQIINWKQPHRLIALAQYLPYGLRDALEGQRYADPLLDTLEKKFADPKCPKRLVTEEPSSDAPQAALF